MADLAATFRRPFDEQVAALRLRLGELRGTVRWDDLAGPEHDRAFMVAGAMKADLLADLAAAVDKAVSQGTTLDEFRRDFRAIVERRGWHGWTGEGTSKGEAWRTRVIYQTNVATSYAAGRRAQLVEGNFKWWVYRHGGSLEPRLQHLAWDGIALPPDHPFWASHAPPNGWGCSCRIFGARTEAGIRRVGGDPGKTLPDGWDARDPRTGAPPGIDRGWDHAPGAGVVPDVRDFARKLDQLPPAPSIGLIQDWLRWDGFVRWLGAPQGSWPLLRLPDAMAADLGARGPVAHMPAGVAIKQRREHPELTIREYLAAQEVIDGATEIIRSGERALVFVRDDGAGMVLVVEAAVSDGQLVVLSLRRLPSADALRDRVLARLRRRNG